MKRAAKKPRVTVKSGKRTDNSSTGGPYLSRFVRATTGRVRQWKNGKEPVPAHGVEVSLEEWAPEHGITDLYLSVEIQRGGRSHSFDVTELSPAHLDALIEALTAARDVTRREFFVEKSRKSA